jgi:ubiquitin-protein ligase
MSIRDERLSNDYRALQRLCAFSEPVKIQMLEGSRPLEYYQLEISNCKGVESVSDDGVPTYRTSHILEISEFPLDYPDPGQLPIVRLITPIFHPNVFPNSQEFCFKGAELHILIHSLDALVERVIDMIQYKNRRFGSPANFEACVWAKTHEHLLPLNSTTQVSQSSRQLDWR